MRAIANRKHLCADLLCEVVAWGYAWHKGIHMEDPGDTDAGAPKAP